MPGALRRQGRAAGECAASRQTTGASAGAERALPAASASGFASSLASGSVNVAASPERIPDHIARIPSGAARVWEADEFLPRSRQAMATDGGWQRPARHYGPL